MQHELLDLREPARPSWAGAHLPRRRHTASQPPAYWHAAQWALVTLAVLFAGLSLVRAAITADLLTPPGGKVISVLSIAGPLALFAAFLTWSNVTKRVIDARGDHCGVDPALGGRSGCSALPPVVPPAGEDPDRLPRRPGGRRDPPRRRRPDHPPQSRAPARRPGHPRDQNDATGTGTAPLRREEARPGQAANQPARLALDIETQPEDWNASCGIPRSSATSSAGAASKRHPPDAPAGTGYS